MSNFLTFIFLYLSFQTIECEKSENLTCSLTEKDQETIREWEANSACMDRDEVVQYYCKTLEYQLEEWDDWSDHVRDTGNRVSATFGLVGSALTVLLLFSPKTQKRFTELSFTYLKIIAVLELVEKVIFEAGWMYEEFWPKDRSIFPLEVFRRTKTELSRGSTMYIDVITLGMGIERATSLLWPTYYSSVHNKKFLLAVNLVGALTIPLFIPEAVERGEQVHLDQDGKCCVRIRKPKSSSTLMAENIQDGVWLLVTVLIFMTSVIIIAGLLKTKKKRDELLGRRVDRATARKQRAEEKERQRNVRLVLLLSLAVPVVTYGTVRIFDSYLSRYLYLEEKAVSRLCYTDAIEHLKLGAAKEIFGMFHDLCHRVAHDSNFYLYILFFLPFREALVRLFGKNQVDPITDAGPSRTAGRPSRTAGGRQEEDDA